MQNTSCGKNPGRVYCNCINQTSTVDGKAVLGRAGSGSCAGPEVRPKQQPALLHLIENIESTKTRAQAAGVWIFEGVFDFFLYLRERGRRMFQINPNSRDAIYLQLKEQVVRLALAGAPGGR